MSLRFVIGRAGAGKTAHCLGEIRRALIASPLEGPPLVLLVPEQASLQMERALIEAPGPPAYHRCRVLSFRRLAQQIVSEHDPQASTQITPHRRLMMVACLLARDQAGDEPLRVFGPVRRSVGFQQQLAALFELLLAQGARPEQIEACAAQARELTPLHRQRLADVSSLFRAYVNALADTLVDPAQLCTRAAGLVGRASHLAGARVWVDGFAGFNGSELALLVNVAKAARHVEVTLLIDPDSPVLTADGGPIDDWDLFAPTARTYASLVRACRASGVQIAEPLVLRPATPPRFARASQLATLERHVSAGPPRHDAPSGDERQVNIVECPSRRLEVEEVARRIRSLVQRSDRSLRYRDIAVAARDLTLYADLISSTFASCGIPCFVDQRQPVAHHPLVELIRGLVRIARDDFSIEAVSTLLKTGFFPIPDDRLDELENFLHAHGIAGRSAKGGWGGGDWSFRRRYSSARAREEPSAAERQRLERVNRTRRTLLELIAPWTEPLASAEHPTPSQLGRWLFDCLAKLQVEQQLEALAVEAEADGLIDRANLHRQLYAELIRLLDDFHDVLGDEPLSLSEWAETLEAALAPWTVGLAPPTVDQVLVGAIERSRHPEVRAVFLIGFNQGVFPAAPPADVVLTDAQRKVLAASGIDAGPPRWQRVFDDRLLAYVAITRPSELLCISYATADEEGRPLEPSVYLQSIRAALPEVAIERVRDPATSRDCSHIAELGHLTAALAGELSTRAADPADDPQPGQRAACNALYEAGRARPELVEPLRRSLAGLGGPIRAELSPQAANDLFEPYYSVSLSALESYASCPYQYFARYGLRLQERLAHRIASLDLGVLTHAVLEQLFGELLDSGDSLEALPDEELARRLRDAGARVMAELADELVLSEGRRDYLLQRNERDLLHSLNRQRRSMRVGKFRPRRIEVAFGLGDDPHGLPPLRIDTPGGREVVVRGRIDRVDLAELGTDLAGVVIDYKRDDDRKLVLARVLHGLQLQLLGYLLVVQQSGESLAGRPIRPAGAFYANLLTPYERVSHPSELSGESAPAADRKRFRGAFDARALPALDADMQPGRWSTVVSGYLTTGGEPGHEDRSDLIRSEQFGVALEHTRRKIGELADAMFDGRIEARPYILRGTSPCQWCAYNSVCRFEFAGGAVRILAHPGRLDAVGQMAHGGPADAR